VVFSCHVICRYKGCFSLTVLKTIRILRDVKEETSVEESGEDEYKQHSEYFVDAFASVFHVHFAHPV
jgi:hypothetical protein